MNDRVMVGIIDGELVVEVGAESRVVSSRAGGRAAIDSLFTADDPESLAGEWFEDGEPCDACDADAAPIGAQEVWGCGVTYARSRDARVSDVERSAGAGLYDLVHEAERPEIFFKATPHRVVGPEGTVRIRGDSTWNVPEPELTLAISPAGRVFGYTIGNDMSSRSIEGENPLYVPQAKIYDGCAALGPRLVLGPPPPADTRIVLEIERAGSVVFTGETSLDRITRPFEQLLSFLFRDNSFPAGVFLMTGTGIVPDDDFTLEVGDVVSISIDPVGTLRNRVAS